MQEINKTDKKIKGVSFYKEGKDDKYKLLFALM